MRAVAAHRLVRAVAAAGCLLAVALPPAQAQQQSARGAGPRIEGRVVDAATGLGLAGALVSAGGANASAVTGPDGRFQIGPLAPGRYRLAVSLEGFALIESDPIVVGDGDLAIEIPFRLGIAATTGAVASAPAPEPVRPVGGVAIDGRQIEASAGGLEDVYRALQRVPGAAASDDNRNDLLVRGGGAIENQTRIDGFDIPNASHFGAQGGTGGGLSLVAPWLIGRARFAVGGFSVAFGERASSVVEIDLRPGNPARVAGAAGASVGGAMALVEGPVRGGGSWLVSARQSFLTLVFGQGEDRAIPRYGDLLARVEWKPPGRHAVELLAIGGLDDIEATSGPDRRERIVDDQVVTLAGVRLDSRWNGRTRSTLTASFGTFEMDASAVDRGRLEFADRSREAELRVRGEVRRRIAGDGELAAGVSFKRAFLSFDLQEQGYRNEFGVLVPALRSRWHDRRDDRSVWLEGSGTVPSGVRASVGLRTDWPATGTARPVSPRVRVERPLGPHARASASWGLFRQSIPYVWVGSDSANARIPPVRSAQVTGGVEVTPRPGVRVAAEWFDKRYSGYPVDVAAPARVLVSAQADFDSPFVGRLDPSGRVRASGVDLGADLRVGRTWAVTVGHSRWRVRQRGLDLVWRPADHDIERQWRAEVSASRSDRWLLTAAWRWAAGRPYTPFDVKASVRAGGGRYDRTLVNAGRYPPYHRLDMKAEATFRPGRFRLVAFAEVDNLYDRDNVFAYAWSASARAPRPIYQWGRTPVGGLRAEF